ncbi:hypothetical protein QN277_004404 [Acacia crassicarpa]|uniref:Bromodomain associated domain-containing protein n=1 Tax=Acacia crassicarpa TaxID=499986 RepID=A0AAE1J0A2_9FABA|nr:hypothetical protein QN277_004404 [Acacia crassicarpa]
MALLGDDGHGYELARKLESCGVWRTWLGDSTYANFVQFLASPSTWDSFIRPDSSKSRAQIQVQLRVRALLFDKATASLFFRSSNSSSSVSDLNPAYLQLHGDDVYYTLENSLQDGVQHREGGASSKNQLKSGSATGSRYVDSELDSVSQRYRNDELPETWYNQFIDKYKANKPYRLIFGDRESQKRSAEEMASYLSCANNHKTMRAAFREDQHMGFVNSSMEHASNMQPNGGNSVVDDSSFFPEVMFAMNCVPDSALPSIIRLENNQKVKLYSALDTLPPITTRSPVMIERLGIRPEYLNMEHGGSLSRGKIGLEGNRKLFGHELASKMSQKVVARMLIGFGFEAAMEGPIEVFSQLMSCHISKLGKTLKVLTDNYRKQCSAIELLKMLLKTSGYSNFEPLMDLVKAGSKNMLQQSLPQNHGIQSLPQNHGIQGLPQNHGIPGLPQNHGIQGLPQNHGIQSQVQPQQQSALRIPQQVPRQMHPQMQQIIHSSNMAFQQQQQQQQNQQQLERMRRRQATTSRPIMEMEKDRPLVQVKLEAPSELPMDNIYNTINNSRHPQLQQFRQQQLAAMSNFHPQSSNQFRQMGSPPIPSIQSPTMTMVRAPPVKVEAFQELMGGDSSSKLDSEENRLTSPSGK